MDLAVSSSPGVDLRRAADRFVTETDWLHSRHSFSFGRHYDPDNTHFGLLLVSNDDVVAPGTGFETHPHTGTEIVTWVLSGELAHQDSTGHSGTLYPGLAQRMSAGAGIRHSERNDSADPVHFVQMWVRPETTGGAPGYEQADVAGDLARGGLVPVASGCGAAAIRLGQPDATFYAARLDNGGSVALPSAPYVHLFVAGGAVELEGVGRLETGDAARITAAEGQRVTNLTSAEVLVWEMHSRL